VNALYKKVDGAPEHDNDYYADDLGVIGFCPWAFTLAVWLSAATMQTLGEQAIGVDAVFHLVKLFGLAIVIVSIVSVCYV